MKPNPHITDTIMEKVAVYEKRRSYAWIIVFLVTVGILFCIIVTALTLTGKMFADMQTGDLFSLFFEDREIIGQYLGEVILTIWEELPKGPIFFFVFFCICSMVYIRRTRLAREKIQRKLHTLASYIKKK